LAAALRSRGVSKGDRVAILSETRLEWVIADIALLSMGAITVPVYPTLPAGQIAPLLADAGCVGAFASTREQREKLDGARAADPSLRWIWCFEEEALPEGAGGGGAGGGGGGGGTGGVGNPPSPDDPLRSSTSGTTGMPGVMLTHGNFVAQAVLAKAMSVIGDCYLSFLPLSHVSSAAAGSTRCSMPARPSRTRSRSTGWPRISRKCIHDHHGRAPLLREDADRAAEASASAGFPTAQIFQWPRRGGSVVTLRTRASRSRRSSPKYALAGRLSTRRSHGGWEASACA
jgi:hypothetical protein